METIEHQEFIARLKAQGVPREHLAFKCPACGTVQSIHSLLAAGASPGKVENYVGFSCVGRWTMAGPHRTGEPAGRGCDWTLGGLLPIHRLTVIDNSDGTAQPSFEIASPEEAKALMESFAVPVPTP